MFNYAEEIKKLEERDALFEKQRKQRRIRELLSRAVPEKEAKEDRYWDGEVCGHDLYLEKLPTGLSGRPVENLERMYTSNDN